MDYSTTLHELFELEVKKSPQKNALIFNKQRMSYQQLNQRANQVAHHLRHLGIKTDKPVVVCMERSFEFFIAILGILKAGGAYIPLDHTHPEERLLFILNESTASIVLTSNTLQENFNRYSGTVLLLDDDELMKQSQHNPEPLAKPNNLAYIIYTSGSTGTPKGVLIEHQGVVNYALWFAKECIKGSKEQIDCSSNTAFDFALTLTAVPLALGLTVVICEETIKKDPRRYIDYLQNNDISLIKITPSYFRVLFHELQNKHASFPRLKKIMLAGENLATLDCQNWLEYYPEHSLYNEYGPTETSVAVTLYIIDRHNVQQLNETAPIGYLVPNAQYHLLNDDLNPVAEGEQGELYLGGTCLARGYLNNPDLTNRYFIKAPWNQNKLYKTGDLCRQLPNGALECMGRIDHQLKIRGFRVELEEIEHCLAQHKAIKSAVVIASDKNSKEKRLIAYYILNTSQQRITEQELKDYLKRFLPEYMIPVCFVPMEQFPLNGNEKLDRAALPIPQSSTTQPFKAPRKAVEKRLAQIWFEELGINKIGINDNFFELGGHSLSAARVISKINHRFKKVINLQSFYQAPTIADLTSLIKTAKTIDHRENVLKQWNEQSALPLSDFQLMLWLADTFEPKAKKLNIFARKRIKGRLNLQDLNKAFARLLKKHKILSYRVSKFHPNHYLQNHHGIQIVERNLVLLSEAQSELITEDSFQQLKNYYPWPKNKPQIMTRIFYLNDDTTELQISMPHLIADDLCPDILLKDLSDFYEKPNEEPLIEKDIYQEYITQEQNYFKQHLDDDSAFWDSYFEDTHLFTFAKKHIINEMQHKNIPYSTYIPLSEEQVHEFKNYCAQQHISILDGLCALLMLALIECNEDQENKALPVCINRVKSTRDHEEYDYAIGCFLRIEPIKLSLNKNLTLPALAQSIHEAAMDTAPYQRCSNLVKLASLATFRKQQNRIKQSAVKLGIWFYSLIMRPKLNQTILHLLSRLNVDKGPQFLVNINVQNSFISSSSCESNDRIFGFKVQPLQEKPSDILAIDNVLDVCFMRMDNNKPYLVLSANLTPEFRKQIGQIMVQHMKQIDTEVVKS